jgi:hypothetical protein
VSQFEKWRWRFGARLCDMLSLSATAMFLKELISAALWIAGQEVSFSSDIKLFVVKRASSRIGECAGAREKYTSVFVVR